MEQSQHEDIKYALGEIKGMMEQSMKNNDANFKRINGSLNDHSIRIRANETGLAVIKTKAGIISGIAVVVIMSAWEVVRSKIL